MNAKTRSIRKNQAMDIVAEINSLRQEHHDLGISKYVVMNKTHWQKTKIFAGVAAAFFIAFWGLSHVCVYYGGEGMWSGVLMYLVEYCLLAMVGGLAGMLWNLYRWIEMLRSPDNIAETGYSEAELCELHDVKERIDTEILERQTRQRKLEPVKAKFRRLEPVVINELKGTLKIDDVVCRIEDSLLDDDFYVETTEFGYRKMVRKIVEFRELGNLVRAFEASLE